MKNGLVCVVLLIGASAGLLSCKDEGNSVSVNVTNSNLCGEVAEVMCYNIFECCEYNVIEDRFGVEHIDSKDACLRDIELSCEETTAELQFALKKGRASIAVPPMEACLKSLVVGKEGCFPVLSEFATACNAPDLITGNQSVGAECFNDFECVKDAYCGGDLKCRSLLGDGDPCSSSAECKTGLYCTLVNGAASPTCTPLRAAGESCVASSNCKEGLFCDDETDACAAFKGVGESCNQRTPCASGNCLEGTCDNGDLCSGDNDCGSGYCQMSGSNCASDADCGTCAESGYTCGVDSPCPSVCQTSGNTCLDDSDCFYGTCTISGYQCYYDSDCDPGDSSDTCNRTGQCQPDTCETTDVCVGGGGTCQGRVCGPRFVYPDYCQVDVLGFVGDAETTTMSGF